MGDNDAVEAIIAKLKSAKANTSCGDMARLLQSLGFTVKDAKRAGHKIYVHDGISDFWSANYDCGHGKNPKLKSCYVNNVMSVLRQNKAGILKYLGEKK